LSILLRSAFFTLWIFIHAGMQLIVRGRRSQTWVDVRWVTSVIWATVRFRMTPWETRFAWLDHAFLWPATRIADVTGPTSCSATRFASVRMFGSLLMWDGQI
jgi:hypothetical protein